MLYIQVLVGGLSDSFNPAMWIAKVELPGGSTHSSVAQRTNRKAEGNALHAVCSPRLRVMDAQVRALGCDATVQR